MVKGKWWWWGWHNGVPVSQPCDHVTLLTLEPQTRRFKEWFVTNWWSNETHEAWGKNSRKDEDPTSSCNKTHSHGKLVLKWPVIDEKMMLQLKRNFCFTHRSVVKTICAELQRHLQRLLNKGGNNQNLRWRVLLYVRGHSSSVLLLAHKSFFAYAAVPTTMRLSTLC